MLCTSRTHVVEETPVQLGPAIDTAVEGMAALAWLGLGLGGPLFGAFAWASKFLQDRTAGQGLMAAQSCRGRPGLTGNPRTCPEEARPAPLAEAQRIRHTCRTAEGSSSESAVGTGSLEVLHISEAMRSSANLGLP